MGHWVIANLNRGEYGGKRILTEESHALLWEPSAQVEDDVRMGLGWFVGSHRGEVIAEHGGADVGFTSYLALAPDRGLGLIVACNYMHGPTYEIRSGVLDILLGHDPTPIKPSVAKPIARAYQEQGLAAARKLYRRLAATAADEFTFDPDELAQIAYHYLEQPDQDDKAIEILKFTTEIYPEVAWVWELLGDTYVKTEETDLAVATFSRMLDLDPGNAQVGAKLDKLKTSGEAASAD